MTHHRRIHPALLATIFAACSPLTLATGARAAIVTWATDSSGLWVDAINWSSNPSVPGPNDDVTIDRGAANPVVTLSSGDGGIGNVKSLILNEQLLIAMTSLTVGTLQVGGTLTLNDGTLQNALLSTMPGGHVTIANNSIGILDGVTANANLEPGNNSQIQIRNGLVFNGTTSLQNSARIGFSGTQTLSGTGTFIFQGSGPSALVAGDLNLTIPTSVLTIGAGITIRGGGSGTSSGEIGLSTFANSTKGSSIINQGTINADTAGTHISIYPTGTAATFINSGSLLATNGGQLNINHLQSNSGLISAGDNSIINVSGTWTNTGSLSLSNGTLSLGGNLTTSAINLPAFSRTGGSFILAGILDNSSTTLPLSAQTGSLVLIGTLHGGTLTTSDATSLIAQGGTLDALTLSGEISIDTNLSITNDLTLASGTLVFNSSTSATSLSIVRAQSLTGTGTLTFAGVASFILGGPNPLSLGPAIITNLFSQDIIISAPITNAGLINISGSSLLNSSPSFISNGTIQANAASITFASSTTILSGTLQATNSTLTFNSDTISITSPISLTNSLATFSAPNQSIASITGTGSVTLAASHSLLSGGIVTTNLLLGDSSTLTLRPASGNLGTSKLSQLTFNPSTSTLNINDNKLILQATAINKPGLISTLNNDILQGLSTTWAGPGITSSAAANDPTHYEVQLFDNALLGLTTLGGQPVDSNSLIISFNHVGDANNNGIVDIQDLTIVANNWQKSKNNAAAGDLNHDGTVDIQDFTIVANNWQQTSNFSLDPSLTPNPSPPTPSSVPEPLTLTLLTPAALLLSCRHRRAHGFRAVNSQNQSAPPSYNPSPPHAGHSRTC